MVSQSPVIIEAAINGTVPKSRNPYVPRSPDEIAAVALECIEAGAAIVHTHTDDAGFGGTSPHDPEPYRLAWEAIVRKRPDALLHPTVAGGSPEVSMEERYSHVVELARVGLIAFGPLDPGSMNVGGADDEGLPAAVDRVFLTTFRDIRVAVDICRNLGIGMSASIFEPGFLRAMLAYDRAGRLPHGTMLKLYFGSRPGLTFGLPPTPTSLEAYLQMLEGSDLPWFVSTIGGDVVGSGMAREAINRGGHVVVGIEPFGGDRTPTNRELVEEAVAVAAAAGRGIATPAEAAAILGLRRSPAM